MSADKRTLKILEEDKHPIQVTEPCKRKDLKGWMDWFDGREIGYVLKRHPVDDRGVHQYTLWREITPKEREEIERGEYTIRGGSFKERENGRPIYS